jgi:hypothetical protein
MTKEEAIKAMREGKKVTHTYFGSKEWMTMQGNIVVFEDGVTMWESEFWELRQGIGFENGYSLFNQD